MQADPDTETTASEAFSLDFSDDELAALLDPGNAPAQPSAGLVEPSPELVEVTRRISAQLLDVLAVTARTLFGPSPGHAEVQQLVATLESIRRLAGAAHDEAGITRIDTMAADARRYAAKPDRREQDRFRTRLRTWLVDFGASLGEAEGAHLRGLVEYDPRDVPLFAELARIPGIGPRRLQRLFAAGLHAVEVVAAASVADLVSVTGLPRSVAEDVIARARAYQDDERRRAVLEMTTRLAQFQRALEAMGTADSADLRRAAAEALSQMERLVDGRTRRDG